MPTDLNTELYRATLVFDATGHTDGDTKPILQTTFETMLRPKEFWYQTRNEFDYMAADAESTLYDGLENRLNNHELFKTGLHYNFFFYEELENMDEKRANRLLTFIRNIHLRLGGNQPDLHSYVVVSKQRQDTVAGMEKMDRLVNLFLRGNDGDLPKLMVVDTLPLESATSALRATVRVATLLSRNNELSRAILETDHNESTLWNWTMTEFDEDELEKVQEELDQVKRVVESRDEFPTGTMESNFSKIAKDEQERAMEKPVLSYGMPIPGDCVKQGLFGGRKAQDACDAFSRILSESFLLNAQERYFKPFTDREIQSICERMTEKIPMNYWKDIGPKFIEAHRGAGATFSPPDVRINAYGSPSQMQEQVLDQIKNLNASAKKYYTEYITNIIINNMDIYVGSAAAQKLRNEMEDKMMDLQHRLQDNDNMGDGKSYLNKCTSLNSEKIALRFSSHWGMRHMILISGRIASEWEDKYQSSCPEKNDFFDPNDIYNLLDLQEFEFQTLTLLTLRKEDYEKSRLSIFKQGGK